MPHPPSRRQAPLLSADPSLAAQQLFNAAAFRNLPPPPLPATPSLVVTCVTPPLDIRDVPVPFTAVAQPHLGGDSIFSAGADGRVRIWSREKRAKVAEMSGHTRGVGAIDTDWKGTRFATGDDGGVVRLWSGTSCVWALQFVF
jgi:WD40 repeat protein